MSFDFASLAAELDPEREAVRARKERSRKGDVRQVQSDEQKRDRNKERMADKRAAKLQVRLDHIAVLDFETDPFDQIGRDRIAPFTACLYSERFDPVIIWDENEAAFIERVIAAIEELPGEYIIYAHNGGKFDFLFLISKLRGRVSFKGRGLMSAKIGAHELRDSYHLIPEKLAAYQKDEFDYTKLTKSKRAKHRDEIIRYMVNDCKYTYQIVKAFLEGYGIKMSIGQAAMSLLRKEYKDVKTIHQNDDMFLRNFFYGGRVECIGGRGVWDGDFKLYDVNSMYPYVMADYLHPIGKDYRPRVGKITEHTVFVDLDCFSNKAFPVKRDDLGTIFPCEYGRFRVSIHEYRAALELGLISRVSINYCVDCFQQTDFARFIVPLYEARQVTKAKLKTFRATGQVGSAEYYETIKDDLFLKLLMNNAYGKFAQNPRNFKEYFISDANGVPDYERDTWGEFPSELCSEYAIWTRPIQTLRFNNVGTAASITGAARSVLLRARAAAVDPIYCDTDSLICRSISGVPIDPVALGAWDLEADLSRVMIAGKKLYGYVKSDGSQIIKCKGGSGLTWEMLEQVTGGNIVTLPARAPTLTRRGDQRYIDRQIRATV